MPPPREMTDVAIDCAIHNLPEPRNGWRNHIPPEDLGAMLDSGSGQITLQACVAALQYGNRPQAIRTLENYARVCPRRFMLSEPWSLIYGKAIVCNWIAVVLISERIGERDLADKFRGLISAWAATCALMECKGKVMAAGCRCWGHEVHGGGWDDLWAFASAQKEPPRPGKPAYGQPGALDDWGWLNRCAFLGLTILRACAGPYAGRSWISLIRDMPRWGAREDMQLLGYADGSRLWIMGANEAAVKDEDPNGNTPGWLLAGVLGGKMVTLPRWPNPMDGATRLRQVNCHADIDGDPRTGWTLMHSHLGERKVPGGFLSQVNPYEASPLVFWLFCPAGSLVWEDKLSGEVIASPVPPVVPVPPTPPKPPKPRRRRWWQRILG